MRASRIATRVFAALAALSIAACAGDDLDGELPVAEEEILGVEEVAVEGVTAAAAAPPLSMTVSLGCNGAFLNASGTTSSTKPVKLVYRLSGTDLPITPASFFSFNPGGSGTLIAKACNGTACTTRSRFIQWVSCWPHGGDSPL
jgi:hypothetical protein